MAEKLTDKIGKIEGTWALHYLGFHNFAQMIHLKNDGTVEGLQAIDIKTWGTAGPLLYLFDEQLHVKFIFQYKFHQPIVPVLQGVEVGKPGRYLMRNCGEPHNIVPYYEGMQKVQDIDFLSKLGENEDFSIEIEPSVEHIAPLERDLTVNATDLTQRILDPQQPVTSPPIFMHVVKNAKMISGFVVQKTDGRCLLESSALSDMNTSFRDHIHCYIDYPNQLQYFPEVPVQDEIDGICVFMENSAGMDHWIMQSLPSLYILDWLENAGVDMSKVKILLRRNYFNEDHKAAFKASGWLDKIPETSIIDLEKLPPSIRIKTLIYPSFMWIIMGSSMPPNYNFSLYSLSHKVKPIFERIKKNVLASSPKRINVPLVFIVRKKETVRRRLLNELDLLAKLEPLGFEAVDTAELNFEDKVRLFHGARVVVASRGAGMTFTLFCEPGTHVHQLCHYASTFDYDHHKVIAYMMNLKFSCMFYPELRLPDDDNYLDNQRCFSVDVDEVVANVKKILARPELADLKKSHAA